MDPVHLVAATVGFVSLGLLWLALLAGLALARGWTMTRLRHSTMLAVHHSLALLGLCLGMVHGLAQLAAPGGTVTLVDTLIPFSNDLDPFGIGIGVVALELLVALALSAAVQRRLGFHRWRALHALSYAAYTLVTGHVLISGSETGGWAVTAAVLAPWLVVVGLWLAGTAKAGSSRLAERLTTRLRGSLTTVQVDPVHCARFGFCEQEAPEVFTLRGDGQLAYHTVVPDQHVDAVLRAARVCPARAIALRHGTAQAGGSRRLAGKHNGRG